MPPEQPHRISPSHPNPTTSLQSCSHPHSQSHPHPHPRPQPRLPQHVRRTGHKPRRPAPIRKSTYALASSTHPTTGSKGSTAKSSIAPIPQQQQEQLETEMSASFLQFCATCERQIFTPNNSILYCSEHCRRKDSSKPLSLSAGTMTPAITPPDSASPAPRPILPSRIPTGASYGSASSSSSRIPTDLHNAKSDLDPTEWKPKLHRRGVSTNSEAFRYLSRFHQPNANEDDMAIERIHRPSLNSGHHSMTSINSLTNSTHAPSLAQTPTTASSSLSTSADYNQPTYDFNTRPLPPRHDPFYSSSAGAAKGIELVMPHVAPSAAAPNVAGSAPDQPHFHGGVWEKQTVKKLHNSIGGEGKDGLGALLGRAAEKK